ncbi:MAG: NYN domain-containing protein [Defluviitaleaceae bacterium]|jgi:hypothetical protein|nr:NYN domain-containing protein [Defluviitaleaceae bacterium]
MQYLTNYKGETFEKVPTSVFVDYEAWFYGCKNQYQVVPDVMGWFNHVKDKGELRDVIFFADFSQEAIKDHPIKLRSISTSIIDCSKGEKTKDYTDFIMLDHIYQHLFRRQEIEHFILFTGDSHFQSIVAFLRNFNDKKVGVYAVEGSLSPLLSDAANWYTKVVPSSERNDSLERAIIKNLTWVQEKSDLVATYKKTVSVVSRNNPEFSEEDVSMTLSKMITAGIIRQEEAILPHTGYLVKQLIFNETESDTHQA